MAEVAANLQKAVQIRDEATIKSILDSKPSAETLNVQDAHGNTPLNFACAMGINNDLLLQFIELGASVTIPNKNGAVPLIHAVYSKLSPAVLTAIVKAGADVNFANDSGGTALQIACVCKAGLPTVQALLELGADPDLGNSHNHTPLTFAVRNHNDYEVIALIASHCKEINQAVDNDDPKYPGFTALHFAAGENMPAAAAVLINHGADTAIHNKDGFTPLQLADDNTRTAMVSASFAKFAVSHPPPAEAKVKAVRQPLRRTSLLATGTPVREAGSGTPPNLNEVKEDVKGEGAGE